MVQLITAKASDKPTRKLIIVEPTVTTAGVSDHL